MTQVYKGKGAVNGIAIGKIMNVEVKLESRLLDYRPGTMEEETEKYHAAFKEAEKDIGQMVESAKEKGMREQLAIMEAHRVILSDPVMETKTLELIRQSLSAPCAVLKGADEISEMISSLDDPYMKERAADIRDVGKRVAGLLLGVKPLDFNEGDVIICGDEIDPSVIANISDGKVTGIVMGNGSVTSHAVIRDSNGSGNG
jgi:phosphotransferase system enzyme I (PtsI)